jgi:hypothetical protein
MGFNDFLKNKSAQVSTASTEDMVEELRKRETGKNIFPLEVFHPKIKPFINELHSKMDVPRAYIGLCMLTAYSTAIGTAYSVARNNTDRMSLSVWGCMNGMSSSGKSLALNYCLGPLYEIQKDLSEEWKERTAGLTEDKKQRLSLKLLVYRDIHVPTLIRSIMPANPKGILKDADEILEWINGLNGLSVKEGTDEQFWLSGWNGRGYSAVRSGNLFIDIPRVFTNVLGGIQPKLLPRLFKNDRGTSGFIFRVLFAEPETSRIATPEPGYDIPVEFVQLHKKHIETLYHGLPVNVGDRDEDLKNCLVSKEALQVVALWNRERTNKINSMKDPDLMNVHAGILGKISEYVYRFSGILAVTDLAYSIATGTPDYFYENISITADIMHRAIKIADYFFESAVSAYEAVDTQIIAPPNILLMANLFKANKTLMQMAEIIYNKRDDKHKAKVNRELKKAIKDYPKIFGANNA